MIIIKTLIATLCLEIIIFSTFKHTTLPFPPSGVCKSAREFELSVVDFRGFSRSTLEM